MPRPILIGHHILAHSILTARRPAKRLPAADGAQRYFQQRVAANQIRQQGAKRQEHDKRRAYQASCGTTGVELRRQRHNRDCQDHGHDVQGKGEPALDHGEEIGWPL